MAEGNGQTTVIGADSHFKGELSFEKTAKIIGRFDGTIDGKGELLLDQNAQCEADVNAASVNVDGNIKGNVTAKDTVRLNANGTVRGDITASKMVMAEGAAFYGQCAVGPDAGKGGGSTTGGSNTGGGNTGGGNRPQGQQGGGSGGAGGGGKPEEKK